MRRKSLLSSAVNVFSIVTFSVALSLASAGCDKPAPKAEVTAAKEQASSAPKNAETLAFGPDGSSVGFVGAKVTGKHEGKFTKFSGKVDLVDGKVEASVVTVDIDVDSISVEPAKLQGHLKSPDLLDVAKFPTARFVSTSIKAGGADGATHTITGNFTLHGVTKSITFPAKIEVTPDSVNATADFAINRKDFGVVYPGMPDDLIKDDVTIKLSVKAPRKKA